MIASVLRQASAEAPGWLAGSAGTLPLNAETQRSRMAAHGRAGVSFHVILGSLGGPAVCNS